MQKQYRLLLQALLVAACLVISMSVALYAADEGLVIVAVDDQGPAAKAGVVRGDILLAIDDVPVNTPADLMTALDGVDAGATITLQVQHGDEVVEYSVESDNRGSRAYLGIRPYGVPEMGVASALEVFAWPHGPDRSSGAFRLDRGTMTELRVVEVMTASAAAEAGLQVDDTISTIDKVAVTGIQELQKALATYNPGDVVTFGVSRASTLVDIPVTLGAGANGQAQIGVKLAPLVTMELMNKGEFVPEFMPVPPGKDLPYGFERALPGQPGQRLFHFRPMPIPYYFFALPYPYAMPDQNFLYEEGELVMPWSIMPFDPKLEPPMIFGWQGGLEQKEFEQAKPAPAPEQAPPGDYY